MESVTGFAHKDIWTRRERKFTVQVSRHSVAACNDFDGEGPHRWAVYAFIYPEHRLFKAFTKDGLQNFPDISPPLHSGPSYLRAHYAADGSVNCWQFGADYHHIIDERFTHMETSADAREVFSDCEELFNHLIDSVDVHFIQGTHDSVGECDR